MISGYVAAFQRPDGNWGVVNDGNRRLVITQYRAAAFVFAAVVERRAHLPVTAVRQDPFQIAQIVMSANVATEDLNEHFVLIENGIEDDEDLLFRAAEMGNAVPLDTPGDWAAAHGIGRVRA